MKNKYLKFYIFLVLLYIAGRFALVATVSFGDDFRRVINRYEVPASRLKETATAIQVDKRTPAHFFKNKRSSRNFSINHTKLFISFNSIIRGSFPYTGSYIDPPDPC